MSGGATTLVPPARGILGWLFDLDGVLTDTASLHVSAWKSTFDAFLCSLDPPQAPFDPVDDYERYVDGRPRMDGARDFLASRQVALVEGDAADPPGPSSLAGLVRAKDDRYLELLGARGAAVFPDATQLLSALHSLGRPCAVVTASRHLTEVLDASGLAGRFEAQVDGLVAARHGLRGKPWPDTYLHAASLLGIGAGSAAVLEDAPAGVAAGRAGGFALVVGVARRASRERLEEAGADVVVGRLTELLVEGRPLPGAGS